MRIRSTSSARISAIGRENCRIEIISPTVSIQLTILLPLLHKIKVYFLLIAFSVLFGTKRSVFLEKCGILEITGSWLVQDYWVLCSVYVACGASHVRHQCRSAELFVKSSNTVVGDEV